MSTCWSEIPKDILYSILSQLSIPDLFCCAAVCSDWAAVVDKLRRRRANLGTQFPWLVPDDQFLINGKYNDRNVHNFYSLSEQREYYIPSQALRRIRREVTQTQRRIRREVIGSSHGWLMTAGYVHVHLENPITSELIELPSIPTMDGRNLEATTATLSSDPSQCGDYIVVVAFFSYSKLKYFLSFFRAGNDKWTMFSESPCYYEDMHLHKSKLYMVAQTAEDGQLIVEAYDLTETDSTMTGKPVVVMPYVWNVNLYTHIVCTPSGDLLIVRITMEASGLHVKKLTIWKVDTEKGDLVTVNNLGKYSLFLGTSASSLCLDASPPILNLMPNIVCITNEWGDCLVYVMEDKSFAEWRLKSATQKRPVLVWFTPNCA